MSVSLVKVNEILAVMENFERNSKSPRNVSEKDVQALSNAIDQGQNTLSELKEIRGTKQTTNPQITQRIENMISVITSIQEGRNNLEKVGAIQTSLVPVWQKLDRLHSLLKELKRGQRTEQVEGGPL